MKDLDLKFIFASAIAVLGIVLSVYFFLESNRYRQISYSVKKPLIKLVDRQNANSSLIVLRADSNLIKDDVNLAVVKIWNSGNEPINKEDLRKLYSINIGSKCKFLEAKIISCDDSTTNKYSVQIENDSTVDVDWLFFDPGSFMDLQLIFEGKLSDDKIIVSGKSLGRDLKRVEYVESQESFYLRLLSGLTIIFALASVVIPARKIMDTPLKKALFYVFALLTSITFVWVLMEIFKLFSAATQLPGFF